MKSKVECQIQNFVDELSGLVFWPIVISNFLIFFYEAIWLFFGAILKYLEFQSMIIAAFTFSLCVFMSGVYINKW